MSEEHKQPEPTDAARMEAEARSAILRWGYGNFQRMLEMVSGDATGGLWATPDSARLVERIDRALKIVGELCDGSRRWTMSVPARPDDDPDLVIAGALREARAALALAAQPQEELLRAAKAVAFSNGFDAALPDKMETLRAVVRATNESAAQPQEATLTDEDINRAFALAYPPDTTSMQERRIIVRAVLAARETHRG